MASSSENGSILPGILTLATLGIIRFFSVPQGYWRIVTAFGKFVRVAPPGLSSCISILGLFQRPGQVIPSKEQVHDYEGEKVFTRDGVECVIDTVVFFKITDVLKAIYEVESYEFAIMGLVQAILRNECGQMSARELLSSRKQLSERLRAQLDTDTNPWGISVRLVEIKGIEIKTNTYMTQTASGGQG